MSVVAPPIPAPAPAAVAPPPPDPLVAESIVASVGLDAFVDATFKQLHGYHLERAAKLPERLAREIHRFLTRTEPDVQEDLPPFDFNNVAGMLQLEQRPEHVVREVAAFGADIDTAVQVNLVVQRQRAYLQAHVPRLIRPSLAGPVSEPPAPSDVARFRRMWVVACDPLSVLDDLNEFALSRDQVTAFADLYPALYGTVWPVAQQQLARRKTVDPKYQLPRRKELMLRILTRQESTNVTLGQSLQAMYAEQTQAAVAGQAARAGKSDSMASEALDSARA